MLCEFPTAYAAFLPVDRILQMALNPSIVRIEAAPMPQLLLDSVPSLVRAKDAWSDANLRLPQAFTGEGVVAGIMDVGFDFTHPTFRNADGTSRIKWFWDLMANANPNELGKIYVESDDLLSAQHSSDALQQFHGTYTWGIAGGSGSDNGLHKGIAYDATLVGATIPLGNLKDYDEEFRENAVQFIKSRLLDSQSVSGDITVDLTVALLLVELKCIFDQADALGIPCVVNWSLGLSIGYSDDLSVENEILSSLLGPGHILVNGVGNDGRYNVHEVLSEENDRRAFLQRSDNSDSLDMFFTIVCGQSTPDFVVTMGFMSDEDTIRISTKDLDQLSDIGQVYFDTIPSLDEDVVGDYLVAAEAVPSIHKDGDRCYSFSVSLPKHNNVFTNILGRIIVVEIEQPVEVELFTAPPIHLDYGLPSSAYGMPYTLSWPSMIEDVISVGAMNLREKFINSSGDNYSYEYLDNKYGAIANFSSCGPTFDGRVKPDVVAPGHNIISAFDSFYDGYMPNYLKAYTVDVDGEEYTEFAFSGTSAAAPVVSGIVALWLQANPQLTPADIREIIRKTSTRIYDKNEEGADKSNIYGWGLIDAYAGLLEILGIVDAIPSISQHQPQDVLFDLSGGHLKVTFTSDDKEERGKVNIYTTDGKLVKETTVSGNAMIDLSYLRSGVYVVELRTGNQNTSGSTLIRL